PAPAPTADNSSSRSLSIRSRCCTSHCSPFGIAKSVRRGHDPICTSLPGNFGAGNVTRVMSSPPSGIRFRTPVMFPATRRQGGGAAFAAWLNLWGALKTSEFRSTRITGLAFGLSSPAQSGDLIRNGSLNDGEAPTGMGRRREPRKEMQTPVRIFGTNSSGQVFSEKAVTVNISQLGAELSGVQAKLNLDGIIGLSYGKNRVYFRVKWVGEPGTPKAGHVGLVNISPEKPLWDFPLPAPTPDNHQPRVVEQRKHSRFKCQIFGFGCLPFGLDLSAGSLLYFLRVSQHIAQCSPFTSKRSLPHVVHLTNAGVAVGAVGLVSIMSTCSFNP